jgi:hypothetical protein
MSKNITRIGIGGPGQAAFRSGPPDGEYKQGHAGRWPLTKSAVRSFQRLAPRNSHLHSTIQCHHDVSLGNAWQPTRPTP